MKLFIGLMSGTSMDGIDAALVDLDTNTFIDGITKPFPDKTRQAINRILAGYHDLGSYSQLNTMLGQAFAQSVIDLLRKTNKKAEEIEAIGSHGQTLCHNTGSAIPYTVQSGCAHTIAEMTGIKVVADFRTRDLVLGGQGAPFAPIFHQALFANMGYPLAVVNIGGIANLTFLSATNKVSGYDIGPGNCLMDGWILHHLGKNYDHNGDWAASGQVNEPMLAKMLDDPFFKQSYPKSIGKEYFSSEWLQNHLPLTYLAHDIQATLSQLTAVTIAASIEAQGEMPRQVLICGGGAHNNLLLNNLRQLLPAMNVQSTQAFDINPDFIEAHMFAWFADKALNNIPLDLQHITGSKRKAILGAIYPAGIDKGISLDV